VWSIADQLRGVYEPHQYGGVILPFTILRRLDCILESTRGTVRALDRKYEGGELDVKVRQRSARAEVQAHQRPGINRSRNGRWGPGRSWTVWTSSPGAGQDLLCPGRGTSYPAPRSVWIPSRPCRVAALPAVLVSATSAARSRSGSTPGNRPELGRGVSQVCIRHQEACPDPRMFPGEVMGTGCSPGVRPRGPRTRGGSGTAISGSMRAATHAGTITHTGPPSTRVGPGHRTEARPGREQCSRRENEAFDFRDRVPASCSNSSICTFCDTSTCAPREPCRCVVRRRKGASPDEPLPAQHPVQHAVAPAHLRGPSPLAPRRPHEGVVRCGSSGRGREQRPADRAGGTPPRRRTTAVPRPHPA
jgi:hypothetical protein